MIMTINKLKIGSVSDLLQLLSRLKFHPPLCIIWLQSWIDFSTSIQSLCTGFCAREFHCMCTRYLGNLGICLIGYKTEQSHSLLFLIGISGFCYHEIVWFRYNSAIPNSCGPVFNTTLSFNNSISSLLAIALINLWALWHSISSFNTKF